MKSDTNPYLSDEPVVPSKQLPLFPLDPWGSEQAVALLERPCPGIARAMMGPLILGDGSDQMDIPLRCLAVTQDGTFAASTWLTQAQLNDPNALWIQVTHKLTMARQRPIPSANFGWRSTPEDCLKIWSATDFWVPIPLHGDPIHRSVRAISKLLAINEHGSESCLTQVDQLQIETQAQAVVGEQIAAGVLHVLNALEPELCEVLTQRPQLSMLMAHELICMAKLHSPSAVTYVLQAMRTESLGVLHLITSGQPDNDAKQVREAIFNGHSLPDIFSNLGIAKAAHRQTVRKPARSREPAPAMSLSDLPISGRGWLTAMRLTKHLPLQGTADGAEFSRLVERLIAQNFQQVKTGPQVLQYCIRPGYQNSCDRLERLISWARALTTAASELASIDVGFDDAISFALVKTSAQGLGFGADCSRVLDSDNLVQLMIGVSQISGKSMNQLMQRIFDAHPGFPGEFQAPEFVTIQALNSMDLVRSHGTDCKNCLENPATVVRYAAEGVALYGVRSASGVAGTISLRYDCTEDKPKVEVQEVRGMNNAMARFDLCRLAQSLADSWTTAQQVGAWIAYEDQCAQWRRLASPSASQLSQ